MYSNQRNTGIQIYPDPEIRRDFGGVCGLIMVDQGKERYINVIKMGRNYSVNYQKNKEIIRISGEITEMGRKSFLNNC